jgi:hypothetical protein
MTFDPDSAAFVARLRELNLPRYETLSPDEGRVAIGPRGAPRLFSRRRSRRAARLRFPSPITRLRRGSTVQWPETPHCRF